MDESAIENGIACLSEGRVADMVWAMCKSRDTQKIRYTLLWLHLFPSYHHTCLFVAVLTLNYFNTGICWKVANLLLPSLHTCSMCRINWMNLRGSIRMFRPSCLFNRPRSSLMNQDDPHRSLQSILIPYIPSGSSKAIGYTYVQPFHGTGLEVDEPISNMRGVDREQRLLFAPRPAHRPPQILGS